MIGLADSLGGICAYLNVDNTVSTTVTTNSTTNFIRGVREGGVTGIATPVHVGRQLILVETNILDERGRKVAQVVQSQMVVASRSPGIA